MTFSVDDFANMTTDAPMDTSYPSHPEGEYLFLIDSDPKQLQVKHVTGVGDKGPYDFHQIELICLSQDDNVKQEMGRDRVQVLAQVNLEFDLQGRLSTERGKNVMLGQLREALGQNETKSWKPSMLLGQGPVYGRVKQRDAKDGSGRKFANVVAFAKAS